MSMLIGRVASGSFAANPGRSGRIDQTKSGQPRSRRDTHSKYLRGEDVVIARAGRPVARMVACSSRVGQRPGRGTWRDKIWISEDFEESDEEFIRDFDEASRRVLE